MPADTDQQPRPAFEWPVRVYQEDVDGGGIVHHAGYLCFLERGRTEWLRRLGYDQASLKGELGLLFVVRSLQIRYHRPAFLDDALTVHVRAGRQRRAALEFEQWISRPASDDRCLCSATVELVCVDAADYRLRSVPAFLRPDLTGSA